MTKLTFVLDGDDVILRTGEKKVEYLRKHLKDSDLLVEGKTIESIKPEECSRSLLLPIIGKEKYYEMAEFVYSLEGTLPMQPVDGSLEGVRQLAQLGKIYILSARNPQQTQNTGKWCEKNDFAPHIVDVLSVRDLKYTDTILIKGSKKVGIALSLGANMFVDDDPRHMPKNKVEELDCLLFGNVERQNVPEHNIVTPTWKDVVRCAKELK